MSLIKTTATVVIILAFFSLNVILARHTAPVDKKNSCNCYTRYDPVCGTDGVTYQNDCSLDCARRSSCGEIQKDYKGKCSEDCNGGYHL